LTGGEDVQRRQRGGGREVVGSSVQACQQEVTGGVESGGIEAGGIHCRGAEREVETGALASSHVDVPYGLGSGGACHESMVAFNLTKDLA
jgi:hypothetical protein